MMIAFCCTRLRILPGIIFSKLAILIVITFLLLSVGTSTSDAMSAKVEDLRIGLKNSTTRLVIEVDQKISPYVFGLANPYRIVIDLHKVNFCSWMIGELLNSYDGIDTDDTKEKRKNMVDEHFAEWH